MAEVGSLLLFGQRTVAALRDRSVRFAVVGGFAVSVRTEPRFTRDLDLAISVANDVEAERLVRDLQSIGYQVFAVVEQESAARLATVRLQVAGAAGEPLIVDLLFASSGIERELVQAATLETLPGIGEVPVALCGHLIALKLLSRKERGRPNDLLDLEALLQAATQRDLDDAREGVRLIQQRGFHRGRDLPTLLETEIRNARAPAS